ncbi:MAG: hypothetical protein KFB97_15275 [Cyanobium sp. M30B3]|nr:MAG: hypothetical protein KFB97_15275 [Cyanobium sp. M30B3]
MGPEAAPADLARLLRRFALQINPEVLEDLRRRSSASGRSIDELALELIDRALQQDSGAAARHPG